MKRLLLLVILFCAGCSGPTPAVPTHLPASVQPSFAPATVTPLPATETALPASTLAPTPTVIPLPPAISAENAAGLVNLMEITSPSLRKVAFSPDGSIFATAAGNEADFGIKIWKSPAGEALQSLSGYSGIVWDLAFSPDGQWLASAADDQNGQRLRIWNMSAGSQHAALEGPPTASSVAFSPDGKQLAAGGLNGWPNGVIWIYDTTSWTTARELKAPGQNVTALAYDRDGRLISGGTDGRIRVWDAASGRQLTLITAGKQANRMALSPDGRLLASNFCAAGNSSGCTRGGVAVWRTADWTLLQKFDDLAECLAFSPDGGLLLAGSGQNDPLLRIRRVEDWAVVNALAGEAFSLAISPDSRLVVSTGWNTITIWGLPARTAGAAQRITTMAGWVGEVFAVGFIVPVSQTYTLSWPGNDPVELRITE